MAAPTLAKTIGVKVANANIGEYVIVRNLTRGGQLTQKLAGTDRNTVFNPAPSLAWLNGDTIQIEVSGRLTGVKKTTIQAGGIIHSLSASADTNTPGVSL